MWSLSTDTTFLKECHALNLNLEERFEVLRAVLLKVQTVWDVMLHHRVSSSLHCKGSFCLRLQESRGTRTVNCWRNRQLDWLWRRQYSPNKATSHPKFESSTVQDVTT